MLVNQSIVYINTFSVTSLTADYNCLSHEYQSGGVEDEEMISDVVRGFISSAARYHHMNVRSGACNVILCQFLAFLGHAQSTKPICSPIRTFNSMVLVFLIHFHCERGGDFQRVSASNNR